MFEIFRGPGDATFEKFSMELTVFEVLIARMREGTPTDCIDDFSSQRASHSEL